MAEQVVKIEGVTPVAGSLPVTGSFTPSGTQDVNVVSPNPLPVSGTVTATPSGTQDVSIVSPTIFSTTGVKDPSIDGVYSFSQANIAGVVATNNFMTLFNPAASGKTLALFGVFISSVAAGGTATVEPMRGFRITTATVGTLQADSAVAKYVTSYPDPVAEVRTLNPTVTLGAALFSSPPVISATVGSTVVHAVTVPPGAGGFLMAEGEGIVLRTTAGDTDQSWNLTIVWAEI